METSFVGELVDESTTVVVKEDTEVDPLARKSVVESVGDSTRDVIIGSSVRTVVNGSVVNSVFGSAEVEVGIENDIIDSKSDVVMTGSKLELLKSRAELAVGVVPMDGIEGSLVVSVPDVVSIGIIELISISDDN